MSNIKKTLSAVLALSIMGMAGYTHAQGKYFEVVAQKDAVRGGYVVPLNRKDNIRLDFAGKTQQQLSDAVKAYVKARSNLRLETGLMRGNLLIYTDFTTVCNKDKCMADMVAHTYVYINPEQGYLTLQVGMGSAVYASVYGAVMKVSDEGTVVSDNDVPFNEYKFVQPADKKIQGKARNIGRPKSTSIQSRLAYPESIFDLQGRVVNAINKKIMEEFFDRYVTDLNDYLQKALR